MVLDGNGLWNALLYGATVAMAESFADVADPGRDDATDTARADQLIEKDVGDGADQRQIAAALADQLVSSGKGNQRLQRAAKRDARAVRHKALNRLAQREQLLR